jgi:hypothetical protein
MEIPMKTTLLLLALLASGLILIVAEAAAPGAPEAAAPGWDLQSDGSYKIHRDTPALAPGSTIVQPATPALAQHGDGASAHLRRGAVRCLRETVNTAYWDGYQDSGDFGANWAVAKLFVSPPLGCVRAPEREPVRVLEHHNAGLVQIEWTGQRDWIVFERDLEN